MLVLFPLIIVAGLVAFFFVFKKELKGEVSQVQEPPHLPDFALPKGASSQKTVEAPLAKKAVAPSPEQHQLKDIKDKLDQKCTKLEQILEEKNQILTRMEVDLKNEQVQRQEFDGVRAILQQQIEDLKLQNKQLKEEIARVLGENLALQTKAYGAEKSAGGQKAAPIVSPGAPPEKPVQGAPLDLSSLVDDSIIIEPPPQGGLTLNDVFGDDPETKKE
jgi:hypothetical protein